MPEELKPCEECQKSTETLQGLLNMIQGCLLGGPDKEQKRLALKWIEEAQSIVAELEAWNQRSAPEVPCSHVAPEGGHYCEKCGEFMGC